MSLNATRAKPGRSKTEAAAWAHTKAAIAAIKSFGPLDIFIH
jgi:hypothetical protein